MHRSSTPTPGTHGWGWAEAQVAGTNSPPGFPSKYSVSQSRWHRGIQPEPHPHSQLPHVESLQQEGMGDAVVVFLVLWLGRPYNHTVVPLPSCLGATGPYLSRSYLCLPTGALPAQPRDNTLSSGIHNSREATQESFPHMALLVTTTNQSVHWTEMDALKGEWACSRLPHRS